jgi:hypothetical protein
LRLVICPLFIGPLQGLFDDGAGESLGWVDSDEQGWDAAFGCPCVCLGWKRVVDPGQRAARGEPDYCGRGREWVQDPVHVEQEQGEACGHGPLIPSPGRVWQERGRLGGVKLGGGGAGGRDAGEKCGG